MKSRPVILSGLAPLIFAMSASVLPAADELFIDDTFNIQYFGDPESPGGYVSSESEVTAKRFYMEKVGVGGTIAMALNANFLAVTPATHAAMQYQNGDVSGNEGAKPAQCFIEFAAKGTKEAGEIQVGITGWREPGFQGEMTGWVSTTIKLPDTLDTFQVYRIALDDPSLSGSFDPSGKTLQITFQIFGSHWGVGEGKGLVIDSIKFGRKIQP